MVIKFNFIFQMVSAVIVVSGVFVFIFCRVNSSYVEDATDENLSFSALAFCAAKAAMSY